VSVTPCPFQWSGPPIRVAATSPDTFVTIGQQGMPIFLAVRHEDARAISRLRWRPIGRPGRTPAIRGRAKVYLRTPGYLAATEAQAKADYEASLLQYFRAQSALLADSARRTGVAPGDRRWLTSERLGTITYDEALRGSVMIGTPDSVTERLRALQADMGLSGVLMEINCGGKVEHAHEMEARRLGVAG